MQTTTVSTVPKINNNELFQKTLVDYPPQYNIGDKVNTSMGIAFVSGRTFNDREKNWRYSVRIFGINFIADTATIYNKVV